MQRSSEQPAADGLQYSESRLDGSSWSTGPGEHWLAYVPAHRSFLDVTGAPIGVQQKLMRHAQVSTTMDVYRNALMESKRQANSKVVQMVLRRTG